MKVVGLDGLTAWCTTGKVQTILDHLQALTALLDMHIYKYHGHLWSGLMHEKRMKLPNPIFDGKDQTEQQKNDCLR
eukprot:6212246-Pleurochrysis_carterae.AAC.2